MGFDLAATFCYFAFHHEYADLCEAIAETMADLVEHAPSGEVYWLQDYTPQLVNKNFVDFFIHYLAVPALITSLISDDLNISEELADKTRLESQEWGFCINCSDQTQDPSFDMMLEAMLAGVSCILLFQFVINAGISPSWKGCGRDTRISRKR